MKTVTQSESFAVERSHRYESRLTGRSLYYEGVPIRVPVLLIEYHETPIGLRPFTACTPWDSWDVEFCKRDGRCYYQNAGSGLWLPWREFNDGVVRTCSRRLTRRRTKRQEQAVEFFGRARWNPHSFADRDAGVPVWLDPRVQVCTRWKSHDDPGAPVERPAQYLKSLGYTPVDRPLDIGDGIANPFETDDYLSFGDTRCEYCRVCDDWLPTDNWSGDVCDHLRWCDKHGQWTGRGLGKQERCCNGVRE